jgi:hypothetical protein
MLMHRCETLKMVEIVVLKNHAIDTQMPL